MSLSLSNRFARAAGGVEAFLHTLGGRVSDFSPSEFQFQKGWAVTITLNGAEMTFHVLLTRDFPSVPPRIRILPAERYYLHVPHVEKDGLLCLYPSGTEYNMEDISGGIAPTWARASQIIQNPKLEEFFEEFASYWRQNPDPRREVLILKNEEVATVSHALMDGGTVVLGNEDAKLKQWWKNYKGEAKPLPEVLPVRNIALAKTIYPFQFPRTLADFFALVQEQDTELADSFFNGLVQGAQVGLVILRIPSPNGFVEGVIELPALKLGNRKAILKGFRPGKVPLQIIRRRSHEILGKYELSRLNLQPVHHRYIHSRGGNGIDLAEKSVVLIGCGSLGGYIAHLLAKAGVGRLMLIDDDFLKWENAGRHILGGRLIGNSKAKALAHVLRSEMPNLRIECYPYSWREVFDHQSQVLSDCDLIISTVGSWTAEHDLNLLLRNGRLTSAGIFTWIEPHAVSGHAMLVHPSLGGCLECMMDAWGAFKHRTFDPKSDKGSQPISCTGAFQPYGVAEMIPTASMATQLCVDYLLGNVRNSEVRTWLGAKSLFKQHGLIPLEFWAEKLKNQPFGSIHHETLAPSFSCRCCH